MHKNIIYILLFSFIKVGAQAPTFASAENEYKKGNYASAINLYSKTPTIASQLQIARAYNALGNYDKAEKQYLETIKLDSTLFVAQNELGKLYFKISAFKKAKMVYYSLFTTDKPNPFYLYQLGLLEDIEGKPFQAISFFKESYKLDSTNIKNIYQIGKHHLIQRQLDSVHKYANIGLKITPNSIDLNNLKALAYYNNGEKEPAIPYFEKLIELNQHKTYIYKNLAECYQFVWKYDEAFECYKKIIEIDSGDPDGYRGLGKLYWREKEYDSAKINYKTAIAIQKINFNNEYTALAQIALDEKDIKLAIDYYKKAYAQDDKNYFTLYNVCFYSDKYYKDAGYRLQLFEDFIDKFPNKKFYSEYAKKRISELKEEVHLTAN
ncbi:tetratricopeptide repeat protein [Joostella atrarenae]|uniref:Tetratricopeptide repeat protein n=1 Tax=Joostella atrarenae TaxID=679257 RepID=A0ABS9IZI9_9FLAO|nr:tetratricopeptide repeat protein [Joostella atrarenae]MCF8713600.1 tetratricopeptide repeat protein [Joostella atrarenae]